MFKALLNLALANMNIYGLLSEGASGGQELGQAIHESHHPNSVGTPKNTKATT